MSAYLGEERAQLFFGGRVVNILDKERPPVQVGAVLKLKFPLPFVSHAGNEHGGIRIIQRQKREKSCEG